MQMLEEKEGAKLQQEEAKLQQGESLLSMFSKLLSANRCTHTDLAEVRAKLDELAKEKKHPMQKFASKASKMLGNK